MLKILTVKPSIGICRVNVL